MIAIKNLSFTYPRASEPILHDLEFDIKQGEVFGLLGPSGSGKSTTQKILLGLLPGSTGTAKIFDEPVETISRDFYQKIGVSFELPALYLRLTARENLELFAALYNQPTKDPLTILALLDLEDAADKRVENFSKGMKMRLNLCRALLHDPELLFLDEPTTGQDPSRAHLTHQLISRLKSEGKTIFLTTHNMTEADEICDRVGFLSDGKIPVIGTPEDLKRTYGHREIEVRSSNDGTIVSSRFPLLNIDQNPDFQTALGAENILSIHTLEATLDEVFIKATSNKSHKTTSDIGGE